MTPVLLFSAAHRLKNVTLSSQTSWVVGHILPRCVATNSGSLSTDQNFPPYFVDGITWTGSGQTVFTTSGQGVASNYTAPVV